MSAARLAHRYTPTLNIEMAKRKSLQIPQEIDFTDEPRNAAYIRLVDFALRQCDKFSLVWREDLGHQKQKNVIAGKLQPFVLSEIETTKWPGTEILSGSANLCTYKLNEETAKILKIAKRLYQWEAPNFPEDLAIYTKTEDLWLVSIAHEQIGWLNTTSIPESELKDMLSFLYSNGIIDKNYFKV